MTVIANGKFQTPIQSFYAGQSVFITGGTGFLGKLLIEKLLRSCPDVNALYILIRPKKGQNVHSRLDRLFDDILFDTLKQEVPKFRHKVVAVEGDCTLANLGISHSDKQTLINEVSIVFNVAATIKFDEKLNLSIAINVGSTYEMLKLSRLMSHLKAIIHVSTAYSNCYRKEIGEKFYDPPITGDKALELKDILNDENLDSMTKSLLGDFPNTYTYTKCIAEQVILQHGRDLPVGIFRPVIVISTNQEPTPGWIDNIYGPTGACAGVAAGLIRVINADDNCVVELIPADMTINALISTAWDVASKKNEEADPPVYNYNSSWNNCITWGDYIKLALKFGTKIPPTRSLWCFNITTTNHILWYYVLIILLHIVPAIFVDTFLCLLLRKPRLLKIYKKVHKFGALTAYFSTNEWTFSNENIKTLWQNLSDADKQIFFFSMYDFNWEEFMQKCVAGLRLHIFKDVPDTIPAARKRMAKIIFVHKILKYSFFILVGWMTYSLMTSLNSIVIRIGCSLLDENLILK